MTGQAGAFGLIVIGDEILAGSRRDRHFDGIGKLLRERGFHLVWFRILPDDPDYLVAELRRTMGEGIPVFSCGGIGATPDDHTRACAAKAAGVPQLRHAGAVAEIEAQFGEEAYPIRIRMADLPAGAELIPNPYNRVPGFSIRAHHFLPGFPDMAHPMAEWVLDHRYARHAPQQQRSVWVYDASENDLMPLMERLTADYPGRSCSVCPASASPGGSSWATGEVTRSAGRSRRCCTRWRPAGFATRWLNDVLPPLPAAGVTNRK